MKLIPAKFARREGVVSVEALALFLAKADHCHCVRPMAGVFDQFWLTTCQRCDGLLSFKEMVERHNGH